MAWLYMIHFGDLDTYYIGATKQKPAHRRWHHLQAMRSGRASAALQAEYDRAGEAAFGFIKLREVPDEILEAREAEMLQKLKPKLNFRLGYAATAEEMGISASTVRRRLAAGIDPRVPCRRATYRPYKRKLYDVGGGRMLNLDQISQESGCSYSVIARRVRDGAVGVELLARSNGRGRPKRQY